MEKGMDSKKITICAALLASMAVATPCFAGGGQAAGGQAAVQAGETQGRSYVSGSLRLQIPAKYDGLLVTKTLREDGMLFSVSEKASLAAAKALGMEGNIGAGWIFSIGWVDEERLHDLLCWDMSGAEVFAKDARGRYYVFYHPTDVRYFRENNEAMQRDQEQWSALNQWAGESVRADILRENRGLTKESYDNSAVSMYLARAAYHKGEDYTVSTTAHGPVNPEGMDASPFVRRLLCNAAYEVVRDTEAPDGQYVVLNFPGDKVRFDFFLLNGKKNFVREVREDGTETLYQAVFADQSINASDVMQEWYDALLASGHKGSW